ncbi:hypothetical protein K439DRAFT_1636989 [Ramaria rubella]|nr:hypothetical protein K439DRAFT_1636989 [Ramaria rubella]
MRRHRGRNVPVLPFQHILTAIRVSTSSVVKPVRIRAIYDKAYEMTPVLGTMRHGHHTQLLSRRSC